MSRVCGLPFRKLGYLTVNYCLRLQVFRHAYAYRKIGLRHHSLKLYFHYSGATSKSPAEPSSEAESARILA
jgi:hypothetical protein